MDCEREPWRFKWFRDAESVAFGFNVVMDRRPTVDRDADSMTGWRELHVRSSALDRSGTSSGRKAAAAQDGRVVVIRDCETLCR